MKNYTLVFLLISVVAFALLGLSMNEEIEQQMVPEEPVVEYHELNHVLKQQQNGLDYYKPINIPSLPVIHPLPNKAHVISPFGMRNHPILKIRKMHTGVDFPVPEGTPVIATGDGVIETSNFFATHSSYGKHIIIKHDDELQSLYAHLSSLKVKAGQKIKRGQIIGYTGNTGRSSSPHLHYEIISNGQKVDPMPFIEMEG